LRDVRWQGIHSCKSLPTILIVEDDHLIQSVVEETLTEGGFEIDIASSAAQAIKLLYKAAGKYAAMRVRATERTRSTRTFLTDKPLGHFCVRWLRS
jgi:ActR/RegA family two-component response regulator